MKSINRWPFYVLGFFLVFAALDVVFVYIAMTNKPEMIERPDEWSKTRK